MSKPRLSPPPDQAARAAIIAERARNVFVLAGAGTGKTKTIIDRAVALLAPAGADAPAIPIQRMALITFTRRAAGELRFRIREQLLRELEREAWSGGRRAARLRDALGNLDAAFVGTIHGFADRLLRLRPVEAALSPAYALIDDTSELVSETFLRLRRAAEGGTLRNELGRFARGVEDALIDEAADTLRAATRAGLQMNRAENAYGPVASMEMALARMIDTRDIDVDLCPIPDPQLERVQAAVARLEQMLRRMRGAAFGHRRLRRMAHALRRLHATEDPAEAFRIVQEAQRGRDLYKGRDFNNDALGWSIYTAIRPDSTKADSLAEQLKGPHRWLAVRLVRLFPVVRAMYECVKAEHEVVDYLDLLIKLRDLLRDNLEARHFYQGLFDHLFVDEFQDTDPLQCEIIFYLCEEGDAARRWDTVRLAPGKLSIVGDPKQSIYRFRRADIAMYDRATQLLRDNGALERRLETNFRSRPELITFFNEQLAKVLGKDSSAPFDPHSGRASYEDLRPTPTIAAGGICVHLLPYSDGAGQGLLAGDGRVIEGVMLARYVRWLLDSGQTVRDPDTNVARRVQPADIAILACVTTNLPLLLRQFDALGIEFTARGGALFLGHPVIRQYLLGLRALADRDDGVAVAALLRPPFFAVDCTDQAAALWNKDPEDPRRARMEEARAVITELRARRHLRSPGVTARNLIEHTALGRAVITGRNGRQTLAGLYEIAAELERRAAIAGLDYDAATRPLRAWADSPVFLDPPELSGTSAVHVLTMHGAKGLEFPVVILWDGFQTLSDRGGGIWCVERDGHAWALNLGAAAIESPPGGHLLQREKEFGEQERRRMYYVAATRARDLLAIPVPHTRSKTLPYATSQLVAGVAGEHVRQLDPFQLERPPAWAQIDAGARRAELEPDEPLQERLDAVRAEFLETLGAAARPLATPVAVTQAAETAAAKGDDESAVDSERTRKVAGSRFGVVFGLAVHRALELLLCADPPTVQDAVALAAEENGLTEHHAEAEEDVRRGLLTLQRHGIVSGPTVTVRPEYPVVLHRGDGALLCGVIDVLAFDATSAWLIDFKTDAPDTAPLVRYGEQLRLYGQMLPPALLGNRRLHLGLLFTTTGELRWL